MPRGIEVNGIERWMLDKRDKNSEYFCFRLTIGRP